MKTEKQTEALHRAATGQSLTNYPLILAGFEAKGIPAEQINPRENVFTFNAWRALGRTVRKGEHGVRIVTFIETEKDGQKARRPWHTTVFHVSQTDQLKTQEA
jgi:antirestriction protein ArdC